MADGVGDVSTFRETSPHCYFKSTRRGQTIRSQTQQHVLNVYSRIREDNPGLSVDEAVAETSRLTGVSSMAVYRAKKQWHTSGGVLESPGKKRPRKSGAKKRNAKCNSVTCCAIRVIVHKYFFKNEPPTLKEILRDVNGDPELPCISKTTLHRVLKEIGFAYDRQHKYSTLTDKPEIIAWRHRYLRQIRQFRSEGRKIFFLDETWMKVGPTVSTCGQDQTVKSAKEAFLKGSPSGLICAHCGSEQGFVEDALLLLESKMTDSYPQEMNGDNFEQWFTELLPKLPPASVIVMDNASYHSVRSEKIPTAASEKDAIRTWLTEKGISWEPEQVKPELILLVQREKHKFIRYRTDEMAAAAGHQVLRLPPYHAELNPIELAWGQIKEHVARNNTIFKLNNARELFKEGVRAVTPAMWTGFVQQVIEKERQFWDLDLFQENNESSLLKIHLWSASDSDSSESEDSSD